MFDTRRRASVINPESAMTLSDNISDKLYEIIFARYERFWRMQGVSRKYHCSPARQNEILAKWNGFLSSHGIEISKGLSKKPGAIRIRNPSIDPPDWIVVPEELAMKILVLGDLP